MKLIGRDHILFERLTSDIQIISSSITKFNIFITNDDELVIEIDFKLLYQSESVLKLRFKGVKEYSFYWNIRHSFYHVETYKLIKKEDLFYVSFDPEDESLLDTSEGDQDFILFSEFEGYYIASLA